MKSICRRRGFDFAGFTLTELLAGIAIMAILAALIIPTLDRSRKKARGIQCVSYQRQVLAAAHLYAGENQAAFPRPWDLLGGIHPTNPQKYRGIITLLMPYTNDNKRIFYCPDAASARSDGGLNKNTYEYQLVRTDGEAFHQTGYYWANSDNFSPTVHTLLNGSQRRVLMTCPTVQNGYIGMHRGWNNIGFADGHVEAFKKSLNKGGDIDAVTLELKLP